MIVFDSNAILRYILQDNEEMASLVEKQIQETECFIPMEVMAEMVYVLSKVYKIPRESVELALAGVLELENISTTNCEVVLVGLKSFANTKLDFVDCLMSGYQTEGHEIYTFDKELRKYLQRHT